VSFISSYTKIVHCGSAMEPAGFRIGGPFLVQEKIDGSQLSVWKDPDGGLHMRSKNRMVPRDNAGMFQEAWDALDVYGPELDPFYVYRGEYLQKRRHNCIEYDEVPPHHFVLWDVEAAAGGWGSVFDQAETLLDEAERLGLQPTATMWAWAFEDAQRLGESFLDRSLLGGQSEGYVIKRYDLTDHNGKLAAVKCVSPEYHQGVLSDDA